MNQVNHSRQKVQQQSAVRGKVSPWTCLTLCLLTSAITWPVLAEDPVSRPAGTRIVQPLIVQASYQETPVKTPVPSQPPAKVPGNESPATPLKLNPDQGAAGNLPEPPKFPNLNNVVPGVPPKLEPQDKGKAPDIFAPRARLNALDAPIGSTPKPDQKTLEKYRSLVESIDDPDNTLELVIGRPRILQLKQAPVKFQAVDPSIADIEVIKESKDKAFFILGKQTGTTVIALFFPDPASPDKFRVLNYLVRVVPDPEAKSRIERVYKALEDEINRAFPDSVVKLCLVGDKLVISGQAKDIAESAKILQIVREQAPPQSPPNKIPVDQINLTVNPDPLNPDQTIAQGLQNFVVSGNSNIVNLLRVPGEQQVMLRVQVAEVNRTAMRSIGMDFSIASNASRNIFSQNTAGLLGATGTTGASANINALLDNGQIALAINALRSMNVARTLAEPCLVTMNGQAATFQAGGEFPVPIVTGNSINGLQGVNYRPFGVSLAFTPIVSDKDRIRLTINAEVSTPSKTNINIAGGDVPSQVNTRRFTNVVELREGQTLAVAGLMQNSIDSAGNRVPLFGDLPFVGNAFGLNQTASAEQELIFLITPELVHPMEHTEVPPLPGHNVFEPGDTEFYLLNRLESRRASDYRTGVRTDIHRMLNYRRCEDQFITGPAGPTAGSEVKVNPGPNNVVLPNAGTLPPPAKTTTPR